MTDDKLNFAITLRKRILLSSERITELKKSLAIQDEKVKKGVTASEKTIAGNEGISSRVMQKCLQIALDDEIENHKNLTYSFSLI